MRKNYPDRVNLASYVIKIFEELKSIFQFSPLPSQGELSASIEFNKSLGKKLGVTFLFDRIIFLNFNYFRKHPERLPYTLFHEMTHLWLYESFYDPNHTARFYKKMNEFQKTHYPIDSEVKNLRFFEKEAEHLYQCPHCSHRWYLHNPLTYSMYCGPCYDRQGVKFTLMLKTRDQAIHDLIFATDAA